MKVITALVLMSKQKCRWKLLVMKRERRETVPIENAIENASKNTVFERKRDDQLLAIGILLKTNSLRNVMKSKKTFVVDAIIHAGKSACWHHNVVGGRSFQPQNMSGNEHFKITRLGYVLRSSRKRFRLLYLLQSNRNSFRLCVTIQPGKRCRPVFSR